MKLNLKTIAIAAALVASGAANANFVAGNVGTGDGTLGLLAWNTATSSYYLRDLGYTLNTFLPTTGATITGSGETGATFNKTPGSGLTIDKTVTAKFGGDTAFGTWFGSQDAANVKWLVLALDNAGTTTNVNTAREVISMATGSAFTTVSVGSISNGVGTANGLAFATGNDSITGTLSAAQLGGANGSFINQTGKAASFGGTADLYYFSRVNAGTGSSTASVNQKFANGSGAAVLSLAANGDVSYTLAPESVAAVPVPAAVWLLGSGLMALGGAARRRKAAAQA